MTGFLPRLPADVLESSATPQAVRLIAPPQPLEPEPVEPDAFTAGPGPDRHRGNFLAISIPAGDLVANGRLAKFLIDLRGRRAGGPLRQRQLHRDGGVPDSRSTTTSSPGKPWAPPRGWTSSTDHLLHPAENPLCCRSRPHLFPGRRRRAALRPAVLPAGPDQRRGLVLKAVTAVKAADHASRAPALPSSRPGQQQTTATVAEDLAAAGIEVVPLDRILGSIVYLPMNTGEAWGYLRIFPADNDELSPADIPVFEELPLDLSVVAGVMTKAVQDANSHVNLKSKERGTPNMVLRDARPEHRPAGALGEQAGPPGGRQRRLHPRSRPTRRWSPSWPSATDRPWVPLVWERRDADSDLRRDGRRTGRR